MKPTSPHLAEIEQEIYQLPEEYLPLLLSIIKSYRQSLELMPAETSFKQGWREMQQGELYPLENLWRDID